MKKLLFTILTVVLYLVFASALVSCNDQAPNPTPENSGTSESTSGTTLPQPETDPSTNDPAASEPSASDPATNDPSTNQQPENEQPENEKVSLDGKRVIIIGNSYVYTGRMVIPKGREYVTQASRTGDIGYFYQLCKSAGSTVSVTNWGFFSHALYHTFDGECTVSGDCKGVDHESYLKDRYFDYVIVSANASATAEKSFLADFEYIMNFFKEANPDVKFVCLGNAGCRGYTSTGGPRPGIYNSYKTLEEKGVIIADWGGLVADIIEGKVEVPGATQTYNEQSFILKNGYDSNNLAGYVATLMAYCAITGESAVGKTYDFCDDTSISDRFDFAEYTDVSGYNTNFNDIFASEADMLGLQMLIDKYLEEKPYRN